MRHLIFGLCAVTITGFLLALGMLYCPVLTIIFIGIVFMAGMARIYLELIPILFGDEVIGEIWRP